jgi:hypothetical protein
VRFDGGETEAELGFAAPYSLLRPHLARLDRLPAPHRDALALAFGLREGAHPPDRFLVGLAALGLLTARDGERPPLCVVDDAHCLDGESAAELSVAQLGGAAPLPEPVPLGRALERTYRRDVLALPRDTRTLLLTAAADPTGDVDLLWWASTRASGRVPVRPSDAISACSLRWPAAGRASRCRRRSHRCPC